MKKTQGIVFSAVFILALLVGALTLFLLPDSAYSEAERRPLADPPGVSAEAILDGSFFEKADDWIADHFRGREFFRHVKAVWQTGVMRENENNGYAVKNGSIVKLEREIDRASLSYALERLNAVCAEYLAHTDCGLYCAVIPDKSVFLAGEGCRVMDFDELERLFSEGLPGAKRISVKETLSLSDFYKTDSHWRQECILDTANALLREMGGKGDLNAEAFEKATCAPFYGVYAAQSALDPQPEVITYLTGGPLEGTRVLDFGTMQEIPVYDPENCDKRDLYTLFLGGSKGFLKIENPNASGNRDLVIFRDSFASSLAPLLASEYRSVTLIDLRYLHPSLIRQFMRFKNQDVLFLFSSTLLNNSQGLK